MDHLQALLACNQWREQAHVRGMQRLRVRSVCISICSVPVSEPSPMLWNSAGDLLQISATGGDKQIKFSKTEKWKSLYIYSIEFKKCLLQNFIKSILPTVILTQPQARGYEALQSCLLMWWSMIKLHGWNSGDVTQKLQIPSTAQTA